MKFLEWLKLPELKGNLKLDAPATTLLHLKIIQKKYFLKQIYTDFYYQLKNLILKNVNIKNIIELGSGGGFIKDVIPNCFTSEIIYLPIIDIQFSALDMPFKDNTVDVFFMIDVFHHISDVEKFFKEVNRCLKIGGRIIMIEPANTLWSKFIFSRFHNEPFDAKANWKFDSSGRISSGNIALPWIVFYRDKIKFKKEFPQLLILKLKPHIPFRYLISGGVSIRQLLPSFTYKLIKILEMILSPINKYIGMFYTIELEKIF